VQLAIVIVQDEDAPTLLAALLDEGLEAYAIASTGGFLREGNSTLLIVIPTGGEEQAELIIANYAQSRTEVRTSGLSDATTTELGALAPEPMLVTIAGAIVFGLRVDRLERW
jgi:uncharacterized protein YaaQ